MCNRNTLAKISLESFDWLYLEYITKNRTANSIADELNCSHGYVTKYITAYNIKKELCEAYAKNPKCLIFLNDKDWLYNEYIIDNKTTTEISNTIGCSDTFVVKYLNKYNINIRNGGEHNIINLDLFNKLNDKEWLYNEYVLNNKTTYEIAIELKCSAVSISNYLKIHNIPSKLIANRLLLNDREWLYNMYVVENNSIHRISELMLCGRRLISKNLKMHGIPINSSKHGFNRNKSGVLYYIKIISPNFIYYKIGITNSNNSKKRISRMGIPKELNYIVLNEYYNTDGNIIADLEIKYKQDFKEYQYHGEKIMQNGNTELFITDVLGLDV